MKYFVGIDGGGTKTVLYLGNEEKAVLAELQLGGSNHHSVGLAAVKALLLEGFNSLKEKSGVSLDSIQGICFGGAGIDCSQDEASIREVFREAGYKNGLSIYNDSIVALVAANGSKHGGILISGTGSIALGIDKNGQRHRVGGWGHIIDDGGSGYAIARDGLKAIMEAYDGRREQTKMWEAVRDYLKITNQEDIIAFLYSQETKKHHVAELAPCIIELYQKDEAAKEIVDRNISELCSIIACLARRMAEESFPLGICGGSFEKSSLIRELFTIKLQKLLPSLNPQLSRSSAAMGALTLAVDEFKDSSSIGQ